MYNMHRIIKFTSIQLLFVVLLFSLASFCVVITFQDYIYGHTIMTTSSKALNEAILTCVVLIGMVCLVYGFIKLRTIIDKRLRSNDRRKNQDSMEFETRRTGANRRQ